MPVPAGPVPKHHFAALQRLDIGRLRRRARDDRALARLKFAERGKRLGRLEAGQRAWIRVRQMPHRAFDIALCDSGPGAGAAVERIQHGLAEQAAFLIAVENHDIAVNNRFQPELALDKGEIRVKFAEHIGELAVIVERDFDPGQGFALLRLAAPAPRLRPRTSAHCTPLRWCHATWQ